MFERILVAFDGSERGRDALALADQLVAPGGELIVCCVRHFQALSARIDPIDPRLGGESAEQAINEATTELRSGATVTPMSLAGVSVAAELLNAATGQRADLIALGSSHRGRLGSVLIGGVAQSAIHAAELPVAIAPAGFHRRSRVALRRVAVACDVLEPVSGPVPLGLAFCEQTGGELVLVAVAEEPTGADSDLAAPHGRVGRAAAEVALERVLASLPESVSVRSEVRTGAPAEQLLELSRDADLLVLGSHGRGLAGRLAMGSVCDAVIRAAACPVLVTPPGVIPDALELQRHELHRGASQDLAALKLAHEKLHRAPVADR